MKLHEVPRGTYIKLAENAHVPPGAPNLKKGDVIKFHRIDGMYSYCTYDGEVVHISAFSEVEIVNKNEQ